MIIGIDASNIRSGGGNIHLKKILSINDPKIYGFDKVVVWGSYSTLKMLRDRPWLKKNHKNIFEKNNVIRTIWQLLFFKKYVYLEKCDLVFIPGGTYGGSFDPVVTMNQNLLPFDKKESKRYKKLSSKIKLYLLRWAQSRSFKSAKGLIFLSNYARKTVFNEIGVLDSKSVVIPHGIDQKFIKKPKLQKPIDSYNNLNPFKVIYVSSVEPYKHHNIIVKAITFLRKEGYPIILNIIGSGSVKELKNLKLTIKKYDKYNCINYQNFISHSKLIKQYFDADMAVFASTCETFGIPLIEGMAAGLPTVCSRSSVIPEIIGEAGVYFDINDFDSVINAIKEIIDSPKLRSEKAKLGYKKGINYSWEKCSDETFQFFNRIALNKKT